MRVMQKKVSLEPMTSRLPSVVPSYKDGILYFFDDKSLRERKFVYPSNYGMIPINIVLDKTNVLDLSGVCDFSMSDGTHCYGNSSNEEFSKFTNFTLSFETLSKWYYFFKEYYHLLNDYGHCDRNYSSATEYYKYESANKYASQMIYGADKQTYIDLDEEFHRRGGNVEIVNGEAVDTCFYKWICENIVPTYTISFDYQDYWKRKYLYYPDVIRWIAWFNERLSYEEHYTPPIIQNGSIIEVESWDCKNSGVSDCCDCEEYFNRGGKREYDRMREWYDKIQSNILSNVSSSCSNPTIILPIELQTSIDDLGQFSIFSKEYELGTDYRTIKTEIENGETSIYFKDGNTNSGTVISYNGEPMILTQGQGFCYDEYLMEKFYNKNDWESYTDKFMNENKELFVNSAVTFYTYDDENRIKTSSANSESEATIELQEKLSKKYPIIKNENGWIYIDGNLHPINSSEFATVEIRNSNKVLTYFVNRDEYTETPYVEINGKRIYAEFYPYKDKGVYYFTMFKSDYVSPLLECNTEPFNINEYKHFPRNIESIKEEDTIKYVKYNGNVYRVNGNYVIIEGDEYKVINGYAISDSNEEMYVIGSSVYYANEDAITEMVNNCSVVGDNVVSGITAQPTIYNATEVKGTTISRLYDLRKTLIMIDDVGNEIDGLRLLDGRTLPKDRKCNFQPDEGEILEPLYQVGNTANIERMGITEEEDENVDLIFAIGDIIDDMVFYFKDNNGIRVEETVVSCKESGLSSLEAINASYEKTNDVDAILEDDISCDITYYIGATLGRERDKDFVLAYGRYYDEDGRTYNYGVKYEETVHFVKEKREYQLKKKAKKFLPFHKSKPSTHSVSYPIFVYSLKQDIDEIESNTYSTTYSGALASFTCEINLITDSGNGITTSFSRYADMDRYNGIKAYPIFREEYSLGISSLENVDSDIYIERGINAAFEKHLKLGEVLSLEALEQYGLTFFKIIEN